MSKRLLIADDAMIIREIIKDRAQEAGWDVVGEACNGQDALDKFRKMRPDVVTLDLVMPVYDGLFALERIMRESPEAKVVVVSALDQKDVLKQAFKLGAADFVVKPFDHAALIETLERMLA